MPIETILFPSGDGTGDFIAVGGPSVKFHTVNSGIVQAFDATFLRSSGVEVDQAGGQVQFLGLEDLPSYTNIIQSISGIVRLRVNSQEDDYTLDLQFFESNGSTALTYPSGKSHSTGGVFQSSQGTFQNHVFNFDFKPGGERGGPCPGNWEDALLKMTVTCEETTSPLDISEIQVNVHHTSGDSCVNCPEHLGASGACCYYEDGSSKVLSWLTQADCLSQYPFAIWTSGAPSSGVDVVCPEPLEPRWSCLDPNGTTSDRCVEEFGGAYGSQEQCLEACVPSWNCIDNECVEDPDGGGTYSSLSGCQSGCWYYKCNLPTDTSCSQAVDGTYSTVEACTLGCTTTTTTTTTTIAPECCDWDGNGTITVTGICDFSINGSFTESPEHTWTFNGLTDCGDILQMSLACDTTEDLGSLDKWSVISNNMPCATSMTFTGQDPGTVGVCQEAPTFFFELTDADSCLCCEGCCDWNGVGRISFAGPSGLFLDPNSDVSKIGWSIDDDYTKVVAKGSRYPFHAFPGSYGEIYSTNDGDSIIFGVENVPPTPATSTAVSLFVYTSQTEGSGVNLMWDGAWLGKKIHAEKETGICCEWEKYTWDVTDDLSNGVSNIQMEIINGPNAGQDGGDTAVQAAYVEVHYNCSDADPKCPYCRFVQEIQFTKSGANNWEYNGPLDCGDEVSIEVSCDTNLHAGNTNKWSLEKLERPCATPIYPVGTGLAADSQSCDQPPIFTGTWADTKDCECCLFDAGCCDWDGVANFVFYEGGGPFGENLEHLTDQQPCYQMTVTLTKISEFVYEFDGNVNGDAFHLKTTCNKDKKIDEANKWTVDILSMPCFENFRITGIQKPPLCGSPPSFFFAFDSNTCSNWIC
jgi:hypothetical protein